MEHIQNKTEIPTQRIEDALREGAIPGFWGTIRIGVRLNPTAALEVDLLQEKTSITDGAKQREISNVIPTMNDRISRVKIKIAELRERLNLYCPVTQIEAIFQDGQLIRFAVTEVSEPSEQRMRFAPPAPVSK